MNRTSVAIGVVVAFGALVLLLLSRQAPPPLSDSEMRAEAPEPEPPVLPQPPSIPQGPGAAEPTPAAPSQASPEPEGPAAARPVEARPQPAPARPPAELPRVSGPVAELQQRYASDPRDSLANEQEQHIRSVFRQNDIPAALFESAVCKQSVCKVKLRWAADRHAGYMTGLMGLVSSFDQKVAFDPLGEPNAAGELTVDVYFARKPND